MTTNLEWQRSYRKQNNNIHTKVYEKTVKGFIMRAYRNMKSRITGVQSLKLHLYKDKELLSKELFYDFALSSSEFYKLFGGYKEGGWKRSLAPSPDRVDSSKGYTLDNMEWVTMSVNSRRGCESRYRKIHE